MLEEHNSLYVRYMYMPRAFVDLQLWKIGVNRLNVLVVGLSFWLHISSACCNFKLKSLVDRLFYKYAKPW